MVKFERNPLIALSKDEYKTGKYECAYAYDYDLIFKKIAKGEISEDDAVRSLILNDLWFILYFILDTPGVNRPFVVKACQEVENWQYGWTLNLWARYHYKSSIRKARNIQRILKYPDKCQLLISHTRPIAKKHLRGVMMVLEYNEDLKRLFPHILYANPRSEAPKWSEDDGLITKGHQVGRIESTIEAGGLKEGMPTGVHPDFIDIDDLETKDDVRNPDVIINIRETVDLCNFLLSETGVIDVWGTPYSHAGIYIPFIKDKKKADGSPKYLYRRKPATDNGLKTGKPVLVSQEKLNDLFTEMEADADGNGEYTINCQMLINPTPIGSQKLNPDFMSEVDILPSYLEYFLLIDSAGENKKGGDGDPWGIVTLGIDRNLDDMGLSDIYIYDVFIDTLSESAAIDQITRMYLRTPVTVSQMGYERNMNTTPAWIVHVQNAIKAKGRVLSEDAGNLVSLHHGNRNKDARVSGALGRPLNNGNIYLYNKISKVYKEKLRLEMSLFPFCSYHGIDAMAYIYDVIKDYRFSVRRKTNIPMSVPSYAFTKQRQMQNMSESITH